MKDQGKVVTQSSGQKLFLWEGQVTCHTKWAKKVRI